MIQDLVALIKKTEEEILEIYNTRDLDIVKKADESPLTRADVRSNEIIVEGLRSIVPEIPIISEENSDVSYQERNTWDKFWLVDPLDGTKEFINRNGEFTVNIALIEGGIPVLGVILLPVKDTIFTGEKGVGSFQINSNIRKRIKLSEITIKEDLIAVTSRSHLSDNTQKVLDRMGASSISAGSSLKFTLVAAGEADIYPRLGPTWEWDTAAGHAVAEASGAVVCGLDGNPLQYNKEVLKHEGFLVCRPELKDRALKEIGEVK